MQRKLEDIIIDIYKFIVENNINSNMITPFICDTIMFKSRTGPEITDSASEKQKYYESEEGHGLYNGKRLIDWYDTITSLFSISNDLLMVLSLNEGIKNMEKINIHKEVIKTSRNDLFIRYDEAIRKVKFLLKFGITYLINDTVYY